MKSALSLSPNAFIGFSRVRVFIRARRSAIPII